MEFCADDELVDGNERSGFDLPFTGGFDLVKEGREYECCCPRVHHGNIFLDGLDSRCANSGNLVGHSLEEGGVEARVDECGLECLDRTVLDEDRHSRRSTLTGTGRLFVGKSLDHGIVESHLRNRSGTLLGCDGGERLSGRVAGGLVWAEESGNVYLSFSAAFERRGCGGSGGHF